MIYKDVAPFFLNAYFRATKLKKKVHNIIYLMLLAFLPQIVIKIQLSINMTKIDDLPDILFEKGLFERVRRSTKR